MAETGPSLQALAARVEEAAAALSRADFEAFAEHAGKLDEEDLRALDLPEDPAATAEACRELRRSLESLGALLGHMAGVRDALAGANPAGAGGYGRRGATPEARAKLLRKEA